jgi:hypothetical protein
MEAWLQDRAEVQYWRQSGILTRWMDENPGESVRNEEGVRTSVGYKS